MNADDSYQLGKEQETDAMTQALLEPLTERLLRADDAYAQVPPGAEAADALARLTAELAERTKELADERDHIAHADAYQKTAMDNLARAERAEAERAAAYEDAAKIAEQWEGKPCKMAAVLPADQHNLYDAGQIDASTSIAAALRARATGGTDNDRS